MGTGAVIQQEIDGLVHPIEYYSYTFTKTERNYTTYEKEFHFSQFKKQ